MENISSPKLKSAKLSSFNGINSKNSSKNKYSIL